MTNFVDVSIACSVGSLVCGALALAIPLFALVRRKNALPFAAVSMGLCAAALLGQIIEYNTRVSAGDFSALLDTSFAIRFCAVTLFLLSMVLNLAVYLYQNRKNAK